MSHQPPAFIVGSSDVERLSETTDLDFILTQLSVQEDFFRISNSPMENTLLHIISIYIVSLLIPVRHVGARPLEISSWVLL
jgi:hypothetical protein